MIYTVTFNPAIDYVVHTSSLKPGEVNRSDGEQMYFGGKGIIVSIVLLDENGIFHRCGVCKGSVKNSVGAGDSMLAGFIAGIEKGDADYALRLGTAAGGATTFSEGLSSGEYILELMKQL